MPLKKLVLIGGGGHCKSCIEVINTLQEFSLIGILDPNISKGTLIKGYPVLGTDDMIPQLINEEVEFLITIGKLNNSSARATIYEEIKKQGGKFARVIASSAYVADSCIIGEGTIVMNGVFLNIDTKIGDNCIVNTRSIIEHDVFVGAHSHISTGVILNGGVHVGKDSFIASGTVVVQGIVIGDHVIVGANSTVTKSLLNSNMYVGSPAKPVIS